MSDIAVVEDKFADFEKRILEIEEINSDIDKVDKKEFVNEIKEIKSLSSSPDNIEKIKELYVILKKKVDLFKARQKKPVSTYKSKFKNRGLNEEEAKYYSNMMKNVINEMTKVVIGQGDILERIILALMCNGHALLEGVPGLAKSLMIETLSLVMDGTTFNRIQFLPDLLPSDIIGGQIFNPKTAEFKTYKGPIFANFVLADEINRAPPKTHAALMECMQERKVNIDKDEFILDKPFLVLATQNPLENKGTYSLPEAVLDRFIFKLNLDYPDKASEKVIITENSTTKRDIKVRLRSLLKKDIFLEMQAKVREVFISENIRDYIIEIVNATRGNNKKIQGFKFVKYGAGPRASIYLGIAAKAKALLEGRNYVLPDDIMFVAPDVLRHRVCLNYKGKAHNISSEKIVEEILDTVNSV